MEIEVKVKTWYPGKNKGDVIIVPYDGKFIVLKNGYKVLNEIKLKQENVFENCIEKERVIICSDLVKFEEVNERKEEVIELTREVKVIITKQVNAIVKKYLISNKCEYIRRSEYENTKVVTIYDEYIKFVKELIGVYESAGYLASEGKLVDIDVEDTSYYSQSRGEYVIKSAVHYSFPVIDRLASFISKVPFIKRLNVWKFYKVTKENIHAVASLVSQVVTIKLNDVYEILEKLVEYLMKKRREAVTNAFKDVLPARRDGKGYVHFSDGAVYEEVKITEYGASLSGRLVKPGKFTHVGVYQFLIKEFLPPLTMDEVERIVKAR